MAKAFIPAGSVVFMKAVMCSKAHIEIKLPLDIGTDIPRRKLCVRFLCANYYVANTASPAL